jgi:aminoglycoside phosphotransferase family enzyme
MIADSHTRTGKVIEYAVKMIHIPSEYRMDNLLAAQRIELENNGKIASILNNFHSRIATSKEIQRYGQTLTRLKHPIPRARDTLIKFIDNNENIFSPELETRKSEIFTEVYI